MPDELVRRTRHGAVLELRLDNPPVNGLSGPLLVAFVEALDEARLDDGVGAVVTTSAAEHWCVGGDLSQLADGVEGKNLSDLLHEATGEGPSLGLVDRQADLLGAGRHVLAIEAFDKPLIAAIDGSAAGGGFALALLHDIRLASERAVFTVAFTRIGLGLEMGLSHLLPRVIGPQGAFDLAATSRRVEAEEARSLGLVWRVVSSAELVARAIDYAQEICRRPPLGVQIAKRLLQRSRDHTFRQQLEAEWPYQVAAFDQPQARAAIEAFLRRPAR
ncbi:MAG: enoyl-CoA hydratase/isomerase family protein [Acidimicrobiales bacterium]